MNRKVTLIYSCSINLPHSKTVNDCKLPENKYWNIIEHNDTIKIMPIGCRSDGDSPNMDINGIPISSNMHHSMFYEFYEYVYDFAYISEDAMDELVKTVDAANINFLTLSFVDDHRQEPIMITIRVINDPYLTIKLVIELFNMNFSLKTRRVKMYYDQSLELLKYSIAIG